MSLVTYVPTEEEKEKGLAQGITAGPKVKGGMAGDLARRDAMIRAAATGQQGGQTQTEKFTGIPVPVTDFTADIGGAQPAGTVNIPGVSKPKPDSPAGIAETGEPERVGEGGVGVVDIMDAIRKGRLEGDIRGKERFAPGVDLGQESADQFARFKDALQGFDSQQLAALRGQGVQNIQGQQLAQSRALEAAQRRAGVRGAAAQAGQLGISQAAMAARAQLERDLLAAQAEKQERARLQLQDVLGKERFGQIAMEEGEGALAAQAAGFAAQQAALNRLLEQQQQAPGQDGGGGSSGAAAGILSGLYGAGGGILGAPLSILDMIGRGVTEGGLERMVTSPLKGLGRESFKTNFVV